MTQLHLSDNSGGDTDTLGPLPHGMGNGPGWSSSDDQISLPPYEGASAMYLRPQMMQSGSNSPGRNN